MINMWSLTEYLVMQLTNKSDVMHLLKQSYNALSFLVSKSSCL